LDSANTDSVARRSIALYNAGPSVVYVGGEDVSAANAPPVAVGSWGPAMDLLTGADHLYAATEAGTADVRVLETSV
jgi:hypothetical protein